MPDPLATLHALYAARHDLGSDGEGRVGVVTKSVPLELVLACGLHPVQIFGTPSRAPERGDRYMEAEVDGEVRSVFDRLLRGDAAHLPLIVLPRVSEQHLQLLYYVEEVRAWERDAKIPQIALFDCMQTTYWSTGRYVKARLEELRARLETLGRPARDADLHDAILKTNAMRRALQDLNSYRRQGRLKGSDLFRLTALFGCLETSAFLELCGEIKTTATVSAAGPRVMLSGSAQDSPAVYQIIEASGAHVVADDHVTGERLFAHLVDEDLDPMDSIAEHYQVHAPGVRQFPQRPQDDRFVDTCRAARVDLDICVLEEVDDTLGWDWPRRRDRLAAHGIRSVLVTGQKYFDHDGAHIEGAIRSALDSVTPVAS